MNFSSGGSGKYKYSNDKIYFVGYGDNKDECYEAYRWNLYCKERE